MTIEPPSRPAAHPDRDLDCQLSLDAEIHTVLDEALAAGWSEQEIVTAAMELANAWYFATAANAGTEAEMGAQGIAPKRGH